VLEFEKLSEAEAKALTQSDPRQSVYIFGGGHVGHALTRAFSVLPVSVKLVETRPDYLCDLPEGVEPVALAAPEAAIQSAPSGPEVIAAFVVAEVLLALGAT